MLRAKDYILVRFFKISEFPTSLIGKALEDGGDRYEVDEHQDLSTNDLKQ